MAMTERQKREMERINKLAAEAGLGELEPNEKTAMRTAKEQNKMYRKGASKIDGYRQVGPHQRGTAIDAYFKDTPITSPEQVQKLRELKSLAKDRGSDYTEIDWDMGHFEFPPTKEEVIEGKQLYQFGASNNGSMPQTDEEPIIKGPKSDRKQTRPGLKEYLNQGLGAALNMVFPNVNAGEIPAESSVETTSGSYKPAITGPVMMATQTMDAEKKKREQSFALMKQRPEVVAQLVQDADIDPETKDQAMAILATPEAMDDVKNNLLAEKEQPSLSAQFIESISFFLPQMIGMAVGGAIAGTEGAVAGGEQAMKNQSLYLDYMSKKEALELKRQEAKKKGTQIRFQQSQYEDANGQPLIFDPSSGLYKSMNGSIANPGKVRSRTGMTEAGKNARFGESMGFRKEKENSDVRQKAIKAFTSDKEVVASREAQGHAERAIYLLDSKSPFAKAFSERALARLAGEVGVLTEKDVTAFADPRIVEQIKNSILQGTEGSLSENTKKVLKEALTALASKRTEKIKEVGKRTAKQFSKATSIPEDELESILLDSKEDVTDEDDLDAKIKKLEEELAND